MEFSTSRYVLEQCLIEAIPVHLVSLAAAPRCMPPCAADFGPEAIQSKQVGGNSIIAEVAFHDAMQPCSDDGHMFVPSLEKRGPDSGQRCSHSFLYRQAHHSNSAPPVMPKAACEAQKIEGLGPNEPGEIPPVPKPIFDSPSRQPLGL